MKLRIKGDSIRLRLGQSEVRQLAITGTVEESTIFGPSQKQRFVYAVCASPLELGVSAGFEDQHIVIRVPSDVVHQWASTDQVSILDVQRTGDGGELHILIEKDFECVDAVSD